VHDGLGEAGGVVLHTHGLVGFVDCEIPDSVDLANLCERHHCRLTGRCAVLIHHVKLCHGIDFTRATAALRVEFLDVLEEAGAGEVLRTDQLAADDAALVDNVGFREFEAAVELVRRLVFIEDGEQGEVLLGDVMLVLGEGLVAGDGYDLDAGHLVLEGLQAGHFFNAGGAPAGPEVEHDHFALKTLQVDGMLAVADGEHGGWPANLIIKRAAVTSGGEGAGEEDQKACTCDLPHKVFILAVFL
jgi:hypothetical protein